MPAYFVVTCNSAGNSLGLYDLDDAGKLNHLRDLALDGAGPANGACYPMALSPDRTRLYVACRSLPHQILTYGIDAANRSLTLLGRAPLADSMAHIAAVGPFLLSASYGGGKVSINPIDADGVTQPPTDTLVAEANMHCCIPIPGTDIFFATSLGDGSVLKFRFDAAGRLTRLPERAASGSSPRHFVFHPSMRFGYLVTEKASTVEVFGFDGVSLSPTPLQTLSLMPTHWQGNFWGGDIRITPDGRFLCASDRKANCIAAFAVDGATGRLTLLGHTFVAPWPRAFNIAPDGKFLLAVGEVTNLLEVFAIDPATGALDKRHILSTDQGPSWVEVLTA